MSSVTSTDVALRFMVNSSCPDFSGRSDDRIPNSLWKIDFGDGYSAFSCYRIQQIGFISFLENGWISELMHSLVDVTASGSLDRQIGPFVIKLWSYDLDRLALHAIRANPQ